MNKLPLYYKADKNIKNSLDCISYEQTYPNQNFILSFMQPFTPYKGILLSFQLGNGKTYVAAALSYLYNSNGFGVIFISHNIATIHNFNREYDIFMQDNKLPNVPKSINCIGLTKFASSNIDINNKLIIIDEAHNLRENAHRYNKIKTIFDSAINIKILIITATPMIDKAEEMESLRNLIEHKAPIAYSKSKQHRVKIKMMGEDFGIGILYKSIMKGLQLKHYLEECKNQRNDIYTRVRQNSLSCMKYNKNIDLDEQSCKIKALIDVLPEDELTVVFSFYIERGVKFIKDVLDNYGWKEFNTRSSSKNTYAIITGDTPFKTANNIISQFNDILNIDGSIIKLLIGSSVMNESISLKNVKNVHILNPFWNYGQIAQAIGRTIRIGSHNEMYGENIEVKVYLHVSVIEKDDKYEGIDLDMYNIAWEKDKIINEKIMFMSEESIWDEEGWDINKSIQNIPTPDNNLILQDNEWIWDLRNCVDYNRNKISWCKIYRERAIGYNINTGIVKNGVIPDNIYIYQPQLNTITAWRSAVDGRVRIADKRIVTNNKKKSKRSKLIDNIDIDVLIDISKYLNTNADRVSIITRLKELDKYFDKQIFVMKRHINDL